MRNGVRDDVAQPVFLDHNEDDKHRGVVPAFLTSIPGAVAYGVRQSSLPGVGEAYHWDMHLVNPGFLAPNPSDRSLPTDVLVREEPEDEEDEEENEDDGGEDEDGDEGYSE